MSEHDDHKQAEFKTALLMAAGMGTRIRPLSEKIPKPLISVRGVPMIETNIQAMRQAGVERIYITVGYKKDKYDYLKRKYDNLIFIENTEYKTKNTISSFYAAMEYLQGNHCIISEGDLYLADPSIIKGQADRSRYLLRYTAPQDCEWGFEMEGTRITKIVRPRPGVFLNHHMYGVAYWLKEDLDLLIESVGALYQQKGHETLAYDEAANTILDQINMGVIALDEGHLYEIDCLEDLARVDASYGAYLEKQGVKKV
ncbi:MAG TPA: phosphocholine cytidylyltransferase family protein [Clostridia bacterium]|nr:phosphocholine cytidylyltransferase family protein [Clostridia bacterium]